MNSKIILVSDVSDLEVIPKKILEDDTAKIYSFELQTHFLCFIMSMHIFFYHLLNMVITMSDWHLIHIIISRQRNIQIQGEGQSFLLVTSRATRSRNTILYTKFNDIYLHPRLWSVITKDYYIFSDLFSYFIM